MQRVDPIQFEAEPSLPEGIELVSEGSLPLVYVIRGTFLPSQTCFFSEDQDAFQFGFVCRAKDGKVARHLHRGGHRQIETTSEVLFVRSGRCVMDIYDTSKKFVEEKEVRAGDIVVILNGGHGFRALENTVLFEIKQGPFLGPREKEMF